MPENPQRLAFIAKQLKSFLGDASKQQQQADRIAGYLTELQDMPVSAEQLQRSGLGLAVNRLRKTVDSESAQRLARSLVKKWRSLLPRREESPPATSAAQQQQQQQQRTGTKRKGKEKDSKEEEEEKEQQQQQKQGKKKKEEEERDGAEGEEAQDEKRKALSSDAVRSRCRQMLQEALEQPELPTDCYEPRQLAEEIEASVFAEFGSADLKYKNRVRSRVMNLRDARNPSLRLCVLRRGLAPKDFASMSADQLASDEMRQLRDRLAKEAIDDHKMATAGGSSSSLFSCKRCREKNCTYHQLQTLAGDEPMTTYVLCNECGFRWKFN